MGSGAKGGLGFDLIAVLEFRLLHHSRAATDHGRHCKAKGLVIGADND